MAGLYHSKDGERLPEFQQPPDAGSAVQDLLRADGRIVPGTLEDILIYCLEPGWVWRLCTKLSFAKLHLWG